MKRSCCQSAYYCPQSGEDECAEHGGFDVCCSHPEAHMPLQAEVFIAGDGQPAIRVTTPTDFIDRAEEWLNAGPDFGDGRRLPFSVQRLLAYARAAADEIDRLQRNVDYLLERETQLMTPGERLVNGRRVDPIKKAVDW